MKLINFVPQEIRNRHLRQQTIIASLVSVVLAGVGIFALWLSFTYDINGNNVKTVAQQATVTKTADNQIITADILSREAAIATLSKADINWAKAFKIVGTLLQKDIILTSYSYSVATGNAVLSMTGTAPSNYSFTTFLQSLNTASIVTGVKVDGYSYAAQKQTVTFSISATIPMSQINYPTK